MSATYDVVIVGGGPVGACAAALLVRSAPLRICIIEPNRPAAPPPNSSIDARVVAISRASERILQSAGAWHRVSGPRVAPYEGMRIWHESVAPSSSSALVFDAADIGEPNLGYIVENRLLQAALLDEFAAAGGHIHAGGLDELHINADSVTLDTTAGTVTGKLVVGADGARSAVRHLVGLTSDVTQFNETAIVATIATERPHAKTAWQRFMRAGTLALLPVADGNCSIVWSADDSLAEKLLALSAGEFESELTRASDHVLGATRLVSERSAYPLKRLGAHRYVANRCALIGDAAHVVHPLAGQGVNLGLMDAAVLAELVLEARQTREDPGALRLLRRYERWRKSDVAIMSTAVTAFDRFLAHGTGPISRIAQHGLGLVNRSPEIKRFFAGHALGVSGELPRAAR